MKILAFDLVWDGPTGWVYWDDEKDDPIQRYGDFKPKVSYKLSGVERQQALCKSLFTLCMETTDAFTPPGRDILIVFEQSDWFQQLKGKQDWKQAYARERSVQRSLGMAEAAFLLAMDTLKLPIYGIGAREAKQEFGAIRKDAAARLLCEEYHRFSVIEVHTNAFSDDMLFGTKKDGFFVVRDSITGELVPHHVTDAIIIAKVVNNRRRMIDLGN